MCNNIPVCNCIRVFIDNFAVELFRLVLYNSATFAHWACVSHGYLGFVKICFAVLDAVLDAVFDFLSLFWLFWNDKPKIRFDVFTIG